MLEFITDCIGSSNLYRTQALVHFQPKRIAITGGYHGCHASIEVYRKSKGADLEVVDLDEDYQEGDLCWLETPLNPTGESRFDISRSSDLLYHN